MSKRFLTGRCRASYLHVFSKQETAEGSGRFAYSVSLLIPKSDKVTLGKIKKAQQAVITEKYGDKPVPPKFDHGLRDGDDVAAEKGEAYADHYYINAKAFNAQPGIVDENREDIIDPGSFRSGDYCRASIGAYTYDKAGNRGVAWGLNNIQRLGKGEPLGGNYVSAESEFDDDFDDFGDEVRPATASADDDAF